MEAGKEPTTAGAPARAAAAPPTSAVGGPSFFGEPSAPAGAQPSRDENATTTHGDGPLPTREPPRYTEERSAGEQTLLQSVPADNHPHNEQTDIGDGADESATERQAAMDMVDRANAGQPVLSGPDPLGLEKSDPHQQDGTKDESTAQNNSGQLQVRSQDQKVSPKPVGSSL